VIEKREAFAQMQPFLDVSRLVFLDESGFRLGSPPHYGWSPRGQDSPGKGVHGRWQTMTMIGAIALDGFRGFMTIDSGTGNDVFVAFVQHELVPNLRPDDIVVMDNLSAHRNAAALALIRAAGCDVMFIPPYSPEYNPIEKTWSKIKTHLRRVQTLSRHSFDRAVAVAMNRVSHADLRAWIRNAGYEFNSK
jgi:transposase